MAGPDIAEIGFSVDTSQLERGAKVTEDVLTKIANGFKSGKLSVDQFGQAMDKLPVTQQIELLQKLGYTAEQAAAKLKIAADAHNQLNTQVTTTHATFSGFLSTLFGYGQAHESVSGKVVASGHAHSSASESVHLFRHAVHALHPELATAGVGMGELTAFTSAARGGFVALAAALVGTVVVEIVKAGTELEKLHKDFNDVFGTAGPEMFEKTKHAAEELNVTIEKLSPSIEQVYSTLRRAQLEQQSDLKKGLEEQGLRFAPGEAGQAAAQRIGALNLQSLATDSSALGKELKALEDVFKGFGQGALDAQTKASQFFTAMPKNAEQARTAAVTATADLTKLFEVAGKGGDDAAKATEKFFGEIKKGGLTSGTFDEITKQSREAGQIIAEAFGYTGPEAVEKFGAVLDRVGKLTFSEFITAITTSHEQIEHLKVPESVAKSWSELKVAFKDVFEEIAKGTGADQGEGGAASRMLHELATGLKDFTPTLVREAQLVVRDVRETIKELKEAYQFAKDFLAYIDKASEPVIDVLKNIPVVGPWAADFAGIGAGPAGAAAGGGNNFETGSATVGAMDQLNSSLNKTEQTATAATTDTTAFATGVATVGTSSVAAKTEVMSLSDILAQIGQGYGQLGQAISSSLSDAKNQISDFFSWLASQAPQASSGGSGGPSFDVPSDTADLGSNATGGIYTIGGGGQATGSSKNTGGTDTIQLKGTVSPGELVAVIPADKANQATLAQLQAVINESPISIGGGSVSGLGGINASELVNQVAGGGAGYPLSLSDPQIKGLLAQIAALAAAGKTPAAAAAANAGLANAAATAGGGSIQFKDDPNSPFSPNYKPKPEQQASAGVGAQQAARAAGSAGKDAAAPHQIGNAGGAAYSKSSALATDATGNYSGSFTLDYNQPTDYFATDGSGSGNMSIDELVVDDYSASTMATDSLGDYSGNFDISDVGDTVDIGANATGGIYTVKGTGGKERGYSGKTDVMNLTGTVSPGEMVAVIPADKTSGTTVSQLQSLINNSSISIGGSGGGPKGLSLSSDQLQALLAKIAALIAAGKAGTTAAAAAKAGLGGGGGGFNTKPSKDEKKPATNQEKASTTSPAAHGAAQTSRKAGGPPHQIGDVGKGAMSETGGGASPLDNELYPYGPVGGPSDMTYGAFASNSYDLGYNSQFYDPYSAYGGNAIEPNTTSYDLPYDSPYYDPYSAGATDYNDTSGTGVTDTIGFGGGDYSSGGYSDYTSGGFDTGTSGGDYGGGYSDYGGGDYGGDYGATGFSYIAKSGMGIDAPEMDKGTDTIHSLIHVSPGERVSVTKPEDDLGYFAEGGTTSAGGGHYMGDDVWKPDYTNPGEAPPPGYVIANPYNLSVESIYRKAGPWQQQQDDLIHGTTQPAYSPPYRFPVTPGAGPNPEWGNPPPYNLPFTDPTTLNGPSIVQSGGAGPAYNGPAPGGDVTVNVFGAANVQQFMQSRAAIKRAMRLTQPNG